MITDKRVSVQGLAAGSAVAVAIGVYGALHEPTGRDFVLYGFESAASWKSALTVVVAVLFVAQVALGFKLTGQFGLSATTRPWLFQFRRLIATLAFGFSVPVAFHCLWVLGSSSNSPMVTLHSILGCVAYGAVVAALWPARPKAADATAADSSLTRAVAVIQFIVGVGAATAVVMLFTLQGATPQTQQPQPTAVIAREQLYNKHCANCHASDGTGGLGSRLAGVVVPRYPDPADQSAIVALGRNTMPAFAKVLTPDEITAITAYTRTW